MADRKHSVLHPTYSSTNCRWLSSLSLNRQSYLRMAGRAGELYGSCFIYRRALEVAMLASWLFVDSSNDSRCGDSAEFVLRETSVMSWRCFIMNSIALAKDDSLSGVFSFCWRLSDRACGIWRYSQTTSRTPCLSVLAMLLSTTLATSICRLTLVLICEYLSTFSISLRHSSAFFSIFLENAWNRLLSFRKVSHSSIKDCWISCSTYSPRIGVLLD